MVSSEINLVGAIHEAAEDEWDKAIELWFYDHPTGFSSHVLQVLEDNAVDVYRELLEFGTWGPGNCDEATQAWSRVFDHEGVQYKIVNGFYAPRHKAGRSHMSSAEHVWMEVEGGVFDPTAGQFKGRLSLNNYWWDDTTHSYGPQAGPKPVYEARKTLRVLIREFASRADAPTILYHGTLRSNVNSILGTGLRASKGWGGAEKPGVFLSSTPGDALYWAKMAMLGRMGLDTDSKSFDILEKEGLLNQLAVLRVEVPPEADGSLVPRRTSFSLPNDMQFVGSIPAEWISVES